MFTGFIIRLNYSAVIVATGQTDSQEPQSMQVSLISYLTSPSAIAPTGQTEAQEPHLMHASPITRMRHLHKKIEIRQLYDYHLTKVLTFFTFSLLHVFLVLSNISIYFLYRIFTSDVAFFISLSPYITLFDRVYHLYLTKHTNNNYSPSYSQLFLLNMNFDNNYIIN